MASVLSFFGWGAKSDSPTPAPAPAPATPAPLPPAAPSLHRAESEERFVLVDTPVGAQTPNTKIEPAELATEAPVLEEAMAMPAAAAAVAASLHPSHTPANAPTSRFCRPYGHAHSPPALITNTLNSASSFSSSHAPKRSFAEVAAASKSSSPKLLAYAQDASVSLAEQMKAKISELEAEAAAEAEPPVDPLDYSRPVVTPTVRLPRDSSIRYDSRTLWALQVEEPISKRVRRGVESQPRAALGKDMPHRKLMHKSRQQERILKKERTRDQIDKSHAPAELHATA